MIALTAAETLADATPPDRLAPVRVWLYALAALVLAMVVLGGLTRLTGSGLSITEWKPIHGVIPPLDAAGWAAEFDAYKRIPQFRLVNPEMKLAGFQLIYWWEWAHRALGRSIGLAFLVPFLVFLAQRRLTSRLVLPLLALFVLGGLQGVLGWWMVSSGLSELTSVSHYRLAAHLGAALALFLALIWVARRLAPRRGDIGAAGRGGAIILLGLIALQILSGALVAGLDAGFGDTGWPLVEGALVPPGLFERAPWWVNLLEAPRTVQFVHRTLAYVIVIYALALWFAGRGQGGWPARIALLVVMQAALGVLTLVNAVPLPLALGHQALAFMLAGAVTLWLADLIPSRYYNTENAID